MTVIHSPPNTNPRITTLWAIVSVDATGEGICAANLNGQWMTLCTSEERLVPMLVASARRISKESGKKLKLIKLTGREDVQDIGNEH